MGLQHDVVCAWPSERWGPEFLAELADKKAKLDAFTVNGADFWYTVPNHKVRAILNEMAQKATPPGHLRSVAPGWTFWAVESMIDELAHAAGKDPVDYRLAMLDGAGDNKVGAKRLANALRTAAGRAGWGSAELPKNTGLGIACVSSQERATATWTACAATVEVNPTNGAFEVKKLTVAMDLGTVVNPDGVKAQIEGSTLWGMSLALFEQAPLKNGALQVSNFGDYTPMRMSEMPDARHLDHRQQRPALGLRRARGHGGGPGDRQRDLQRGRRAGAQPADHPGRGAHGAAGEEDLTSSSSPRRGRGWVRESKRAAERPPLSVHGCPFTAPSGYPVEKRVEAQAGRSSQA